MNKKKLLHFGLNRSGTNYLNELIQLYFDVEIVNVEGERNHPLHKHFRLYDDKNLIGRPNFINNIYLEDFTAFDELIKSFTPYDGIIVVSKDPYSWHLSYKKWGEKNNWPPSPHPYLKEYMEFHRKWMEFKDDSDKILHIRYIDLLMDKEEQMSIVKNQFALKQIKDFDNKRLKKVPMSHRFSDKKVKYYVEEQYLSELGKTEINNLNKLIDNELILKMGYKIYNS